MGSKLAPKNLELTFLADHIFKIEPTYLLETTRLSYFDNLPPNMLIEDHMINRDPRVQVFLMGFPVNTYWVSKVYLAFPGISGLNGHSVLFT